MPAWLNLDLSPNAQTSTTTCGEGGLTASCCSLGGRSETEIATKGTALNMHGSAAENFVYSRASTSY